MTEDNRPLYDIESLWETDYHIPGRLIKSHHKEYDSLYRLIDFEDGRYLFSDFHRIEPKNILDINKDIGIKRKCDLQEKALAIVNQLRPITMPYLPEVIKVYVEDLDSYVGFLYFRSNLDPENMIPIKAFFKVVRDPVINYIPCTFEEFNNFKETVDEKLD